MTWALKGRGLPLAHAAAWTALAAAAAACASSPPNLIAEGYEGAPDVRRILLCPPNLVLALRAEIQGGSKWVDREIGTYLESHGREVERLGLIEGRTLWKQSVALARAADAIENAPGIFAGELAKEHAFDALVVPSLLLHQVRMDASNASWDGVSRRMKMLNAPHKGIGREDSTLARGVAYGGISGPAWVTSLHLLVLAPDGRRVFEGRGGIEFLHEIDLIDQGRSYRYEMRQSSSLFLDQSLLHEGVVRAFEPYLPPPDE